MNKEEIKLIKDYINVNKLENKQNIFHEIILHIMMKISKSVINLIDNKIILVLVEYLNRPSTDYLTTIVNEVKTNNTVDLQEDLKTIKKENSRN